MSTREQKLEEFARAWADADRNYAADVVAAGGDGKLVQDIDDNWWRHQANWSRAATAALANTSDQIEALYEDALAANDKIAEARARAEKIARIVKASSKVASSLTALLKAVA